MAILRFLHQLLAFSLEMAMLAALEHVEISIAGLQTENFISSHR